LRNLVLVLGDQLDPQSLALEDFDPNRDRIWMAEVPEESEHVWSHKARTALFFSAMCHFAKDLEERAIPVRYLRIGAHPFTGFADALEAEVSAERPKYLVVVEPGDYRVLVQLREVASSTGLTLEIRRSRNFLINLRFRRVSRLWRRGGWVLRRCRERKRQSRTAPSRCRESKEGADARPLACSRTRSASPVSYARHMLPLIDPLGDRVVNLLMKVASRNHGRENLAATSLDLAHFPVIIPLGCLNLLFVRTHFGSPLGISL